MWKGTPRAVAEKLVSVATLTNSPVLNVLMRRLLASPAEPLTLSTDGKDVEAQSLTAMRVEKLALFSDTEAAWSLAGHAGPGLVDDVTFRYAAGAQLASDADPICKNLDALSKARPNIDWRKSIAVCALREQNAKIAGDALNLLSADVPRDDMFLEVANKDIPGDGKMLPHQLTPLSAEMLALLRLTGLPLPGEVYGHPDFALVPALLQAPARQDAARLGLAERAASRGIIAPGELETIYRAAAFTPDQLAAPGATGEAGARLRALLYQAAFAAKQTGDKASLAVRFVQSAPPELLNGAGSIAADMAGTISATASPNAAYLAQIYMLAGKGDLALDWLRVAKHDPLQAAQVQLLWPQIALSGLEASGDFAADFAAWLDGTLKSSDPAADMRATLNFASAQTLLLDAAGFPVPETAWSHFFVASHNEKHVALQPVFLERLQAAGSAGRRAETIALSVALAGDSDISLPAAVSIVRALRSAGYNNEAGQVAQQTIALMLPKATGAN
jgi:hypothetical protein